jgi:hypothetical protein
MKYACEFVCTASNLLMPDVDFNEIRALGMRKLLLDFGSVY